MDKQEINGSLIVHGVIGVGDFPNGAQSGGVDIDGPLHVRSRFRSTLLGGVSL